MKRKFKFLIIYFIFLIFHSTSNAKIENKIILKVENEIITNFEIKNKILVTLMLSDKEINQKNIDDLKNNSLDFLINLKLQKIELSKYKIPTDEQEVSQYINRMASNDIISFKNKFSNNNLDFNLFREEIAIQLRWQKFIYQMYSNKIKIDEKTLDNEINEIFKNQNFVDEFRISEIEVQLAGNEANKNKINEIQKLINEIGFGKAALKLSVSTSATEEGDLGWLTAKSLSDEIYDVISNMQINEITDPIIDQNRILFLKLNDKRKLKTENIDANLLRKNLVNRKKNELYNLYSRSHLSKLRNTTSIEYK